MKKHSLLFVFFLLCITVKAQSIAIIKDADGFVNVRQSQNINAKIVGKLDSNAIFDVVEDEKPNSSNWTKIYLPLKTNNSITGYIHKSRLLLLSSFKKVNKINFNKNFCTAKNDSIAVTVSSAKFFPKDHIIKYHKETIYNESSFWEKIDGKKIWGTDGELPKVAITSLSVKINGQGIIIPKSAYNDLYEPRFSSLNVYLASNNTFYIQLDNSDGAGAYTVIWVIKNGKFYNRFVEDLC